MSSIQATDAVAGARPALPHQALFAIAVGLATLILMLPAIINGSPFIFFDSAQYFDVGGKIFGSVVHAANHAAAAGADAGASAGQGAGSTAPVGNGGLAAVAGGRSPTYSAFFYGTANFFSMWITATLQALVCAVLIVRFALFAWGRISLPVVAGVSAALGFASGLGFQAAFMMPDVFCGCLMLTLAIYLFERPASRIENALLLVGVFFFASVHATNVLLLLAALVVVAAIGLVMRRPLRPLLVRLGSLFAVAIAVIGMGFWFSAAVQKISGHKVSSPPYLMARVIADGPGATYIERACKGRDQPFAACAFAGQHFSSQDAVLWNGSDKGGSFAASSPELKARLTAEEKSFVIAAILSDPAGQFAASFSNFGQQLVRAGIDEIDGGAQLLVQNAGFVDSPVIALTPEGQRCLRDAASCKPQPWYKAWKALVAVINALILPAFAAMAVALLATRRTRVAPTPPMMSRLIEVCVFLFILAVVNAGMTGVLSGPNGRYQTRLLWALALTMIAVAPMVWRAVWPRANR